MRSGNILLLLLCYVAFFISRFHFGYTSTNSSSYSKNSNATSCIESERRALLEFKASLVDTANRLASWTAGEDCCNWAGVTCNPRTGHVQKLHLRNPIQIYIDAYDPKKNNFVSYHNNCLRGEINPSMLDLEHLKYLDLSSNNFSGIQIPTFLGSFKNLRYLNLTAAGFSGETPPHLGNLSHLQYLSLGSNQESDVSISNYLSSKSLMWITRLLSLKVLDLSGIILAESVDWWYSVNMLPSLSSLSLRDCGIVVGTYLSPPVSQVVNLTSLVSLDVGGNDLTSNSTTFFSLFNVSNQLAVLRLDNNQLQDPTPIISEKLLPALTVLDVSYNNFNSPSMLQSLCNHTNLVSLGLSGNQLQGSLPSCLGNLTSLMVLDLSGNKFGGKIPSELGHLIQLTSLDLSSNQFKSSIPSSFGQLSKLKILYLSNSQLHGVIPSTLGQLSKLQYFYASRNSLTSELPSTLGQLAELQELVISHNSFTGQLSESHFEKLKCLKYLSISHNYFLSFIVSSHWVPLFQLREIHMDSVRLGPQFPAWLKTQRDAVVISMNNASISGVIPASFMTSCSFIQTLDLSNNNIHGSIPPNIESLVLSNNLFTLSDISYVTNMSVIVNLQLDNNLLTGDIPNDLCNLLNLSILSVANNQLTGNIPLCFGNLQKLVILDLANNSISGHIPSNLGYLPRLRLLHLSRNKLHGVLPSSLKNLKFLMTLDLGENQLAGTIPEWIGKELSSLKFLRLQSNNFYGNISLHLCQLSLLKILNLAENNLVGHIPHCFGNFSGMILTSDVLSLSSGSYTEELWNIIKGVELQYSSNLDEVISISLSGNNLHGVIPTELMILEELQSLNLSNNKLSGPIPEKISNLKHLESLDLAMNQLAGPIPQSLASIDSLGFLNLSFNNLVGRIPSGNHFDTFNDPSIYEGNIGLCGKPLARNCLEHTSSEGKEPAFHKNIDERFEMPWFYSGTATGFGVGFVGVFCVLCWKKSWRYAYFRYIESICEKVWVSFVVKISQFQRKHIN